MLIPSVSAVLLRDLATLRAEVEAYAEEADLWRTAEGITNPAGTLVLHLTGNLQHFVGAVLGGTGYVRDRDAEFARRDVPRAVLLAEIDRSSNAVDGALHRLTDGDLRVPFPVEIAGRELSTAEALVHLASHLAYHLGQVNYHRRLVARGAPPG